MIMNNICYFAKIWYLPMNPQSNSSLFAVSRSFSVMDHFDPQKTHVSSPISSWSCDTLNLPTKQSIVPNSKRGSTWYPPWVNLWRIPDSSETTNPFVTHEYKAPWKPSWKPCKWPSEKNTMNNCAKTLSEHLKKTSLKHHETIIKPSWAMSKTNH